MTDEEKQIIDMFVKMDSIGAEKLRSNFGELTLMDKYHEYTKKAVEENISSSNESVD